MANFTYVELFAGIGGVSFGFNRNGGRCVMASEIDKFATQAYSILHPGVDLRGDITQIDEKDVPDHDILSFTTPCQSFSVAGKRLGFEDTRGTLVFEALRIAKYKQPKILFMENVKGLISHDSGRTLETIILAMNDIGYTVDFEVLNSKYFGVPQNRERIFIVGIRDDLIEPQAWEIGKRTDVVAKGKRRIAQIDGVKTFNFDYPEQKEVTTRLRDILEENVDERYYLSEEKTAKLVAQLTEGAGLGKDGLLGTVVDGGNISPCIDASYAKGIGPSDVAKNRNRRPHMLEEVRPVLTPERVEKRQNGRRFKDDGEEAFTLTAQDKHGVAIGTKTEGRQRYRIRKLTPRECFRLQGFSDAEFDKLAANGISNSQLYKQAGNAVTVNVIDAIGRRLLPFICD